MQPRHMLPEYKLGLLFIKTLGQATVRELCAEVGISRNNMHHYIKLWREREGLRVVDWRQNLGVGGALTPVHGFAEEDVPKPKYNRRKGQRASQRRCTQNNRMLRSLKKRADRGTPTMFAQLAIANSGR